MLNSKLLLNLFCISLSLFLGRGTSGYSQVITKNNNGPTLTIFLKKLNKQYQTRISFSYTLTDGVRPQVKDLTGPLTEDLEKLLEGTNLNYKIVNGYYYIYKVKSPIAKPPTKLKPKKESEERISLPPISAVPHRITFANRKIIPDLKYHTPIINPVHPDEPKIGVKTNLLYDITTTLNLGVEFVVANKWTMDIGSNLNFWSFSSGARKWKQAIIQPELRYWPCERFNGHFVGVHLHTGIFNIGGLPTLGGFVSENMQQYRYQGYFYGGGVTYGYHTILSNRWSLETAIGLGYAHINYDKYPCGNCGRKIKDNSKNYFGPTKVSISLIYNIK